MGQNAETFVGTVLPQTSVDPLQIAYGDYKLKQQQEIKAKEAEDKTAQDVAKELGDISGKAWNRDHPFLQEATNKFFQNINDMQLKNPGAVWRPGTAENLKMQQDKAGLVGWFNASADSKKNHDTAYGLYSKEPDKYTEDTPLNLNNYANTHLTERVNMTAPELYQYKDPALYFQDSGIKPESIYPYTVHDDKTNMDMVYNGKKYSPKQIDRIAEGALSDRGVKASLQKMHKANGEIGTLKEFAKQYYTDLAHSELTATGHYAPLEGGANGAEKAKSAEWFGNVVNDILVPTAKSGAQTSTFTFEGDDTPLMIVKSGRGAKIRWTDPDGTVKEGEQGDIYVQPKTGEFVAVPIGQDPETWINDPSKHWPKERALDFGGSLFNDANPGSYGLWKAETEKRGWLTDRGTTVNANALTGGREEETKQRQAQFQSELDTKKDDVKTAINSGLGASFSVGGDVVIGIPGTEQTQIYSKPKVKITKLSGNEYQVQIADESGKVINNSKTTKEKLIKFIESIQPKAGVGEGISGKQPAAPATGASKWDKYEKK